MTYPSGGSSEKWEPIFDAVKDGDVHSALVQSLEEISSALVPPAFADEPSLASGWAGISLLHFYRTLAFSQASHRVTDPLAFIELARKSLESTRVPPPGLFWGFTGVAWALNHIAGTTNNNDVTSEVDDVLRSWLNRGAPRALFDLTYGLTGIGVYALDRGQHTGQFEIVELLVEQLRLKAEDTPLGFRWRSPFPFPGYEHEGYYHIGLAHGSSGVIAFLAMCHQLGISRPAIDSLLEGAIDYVIATMGSRTETRCSWCWGLPGMGYVLLLAGRYTSNPKCERLGEEMGVWVAQRGIASIQFKDVCMCHGTVGLGHIMNRYYQLTKDPLFMEAARAWFIRTLDYRVPGSGIAGYSCLAEDDPTRDLLPKAGVLFGVAGVALAILSALSPVRPHWDRFMLPSLSDTPQPRPSRSQ